MSRPCSEDGCSPVNPGKVERGLEDLTSDSCGTVKGEYIEGLDGEVRIRVPKTRNSTMTLSGKVTCERHRYRRAGSPSLVPVDEQPGLAMDYFTEQDSDARSGLWRRIGGMTLTESTLQHLEGPP